MDRSRLRQAGGLLLAAMGGLTLLAVGSTLLRVLTGELDQFFVWLGPVGTVAYSADGTGLAVLAGAGGLAAATVAVGALTVVRDDAWWAAPLAAFWAAAPAPNPWIAGLVAVPALALLVAYLAWPEARDRAESPGAFRQEPRTWTTWLVVAVVAVTLVRNHLTRPDRLVSVAAIAATAGLSWPGPRRDVVRSVGVVPALAVIPDGTLLSVAAIASVWAAGPIRDGLDRLRGDADAAKQREVGEEIVVGGTFRDRYEVRQKLGTGGMGQTFRARDTVIDRDVVLKDLLPHLRDDPKHLNALLREAKAAGNLEHRNVVTLLDVVRGDDRTVLVLEHVPGGSLADRIDEAPLDLDDAAGYLDQLLEALTALHDRGITHRDVKPENVLVDEDGTVKLTDFGVAQLPSGGTLATRSQPGTIKYMSPEQVRGRDLDGRTDLYATAAIGHELLTGRSYLDFDDRSAYEAQRAIVEAEPDLDESLDDDVRDFLQRGLAKDPDDRFDDAEAMRAALAELTG